MSAVHFARDHEEACQLLYFLHGEGHRALADGDVRPRIRVPGLTQEELTARVAAWQRGIFEAEVAREAREGRRG